MLLDIQKHFSEWVKNQDQQAFQWLVSYYQREQDLESLSELLEMSGSLERQALYDALKNDILTWIKNAQDFGDVCRRLSRSQRDELYESKKINIPEWIHSAQDFENVCHYLEPEQYTEIYELKKTEMPTWVHNAEDFFNLCVCLSSKQRTEIYEAQKANIPEWIHDIESFRHVISLLKNHQLKEMYDAKKENITTWIKNINDFKLVLMYLEHPERNAIALALTDLTWIDSPDTLRRLLLCFDSEGVKNFCEARKEKILMLIKNTKDFCNIFFHIFNPLGDEGTDALFLVLRDNMLTWITDVASCHEVLLASSDEQKKIVYDVCKDRLPTWIKSADDLASILQFFSPEEHSEFYAKVKGDIPGLIKNENDLTVAVRCLKPAEVTEVCLALINMNPTWLQQLGIERFTMMLRFLNPEIVRPVCVAMKDILPMWIEKGPQLALWVRFGHPTTLCGYAVPRDTLRTALKDDATDRMKKNMHNGADLALFIAMHYLEHSRENQNLPLPDKIENTIEMYVETFTERYPKKRFALSKLFSSDDIISKLKTCATSSEERFFAIWNHAKKDPATANIVSSLEVSSKLGKEETAETLSLN